MSTSNRRQAFAQPQTNPATKFIEWKSNDKSFNYYDKEAQKNVAIPLPFKFLVLDELHKVEGWNDSLKGKIVSNEVKFISKEIMKVKTYHKDFGGKNTTTHLVDGLYAEIKEKVKSSNAHYAKSIYVMLEDGSLANISLKGSGVQKWGDFTQKTRNRLADEWVIVATAEDGKKGAVKFSTPSFSFANSISDEEANMADEAFNILESYLKTYLAKAEQAIVEEEDDSFDIGLTTEDGLHF
jgi:hypothetical protein